MQYFAKIIHAHDLQLDGKNLEPELPLEIKKRAGTKKIQSNPWTEEGGVINSVAIIRFVDITYPKVACFPVVESGKIDSSVLFKIIFFVPSTENAMPEKSESDLLCSGSN